MNLKRHFFFWMEGVHAIQVQIRTWHSNKFFRLLSLQRENTFRTFDLLGALVFPPTLIFSRHMTLLLPATSCCATPILIFYIRNFKLLEQINLFFLIIISHICYLKSNFEPNLTSQAKSNSTELATNIFLISQWERGGGVFESPPPD